MNDPTPAEAFPPSKFIADELEARGWTEEEFAAKMVWPRSAVRKLLDGKLLVSPSVAADLGWVFGNTAAYWLNLEHAYQQWRLRSEDS